MNNTGESKGLQILKSLVPYFVIILIIILFKSFIITPVKVVGNSMIPTLDDGNIMLLDIISFKLKGADRFDIVVINQGKELIIKRVIGLPGDSIEYKDSQLYVNGKEVEDPFVTSYGFTQDLSVKVPKDHYYVLGDNRHNSNDSRTYGPFHKSQIIGKTDLVLYPFNEFGLRK